MRVARRCTRSSGTSCARRSDSRCRASATIRCGWLARLQRRAPPHRSHSRFAAFIAAVAGVLFVWWNGHIDPASIDSSATIDVLVIAVIGGLYRLEGAWLGAFVFVIINNYSQRISFIGAALPHADRRDLPRHRAGLARRPDRPLGARARPRLRARAAARAIGIRSSCPARAHASERRRHTQRAGHAQRFAGSTNNQQPRGGHTMSNSEGEAEARFRSRCVAVLRGRGAPRRQRPTDDRRPRRRSRSPYCPTARARSARSTGRTWPASSPAMSEYAGGEAGQPNDPRKGWTGGSISGHPLKLVGIGCSQRPRGHGDQGDQAAHGAAEAPTS